MNADDTTPHDPVPPPPAPVTWPSSAAPMYGTSTGAPAPDAVAAVLADPSVVAHDDLDAADDVDAPTDADATDADATGEASPGDGTPLYGTPPTDEPRKGPASRGTAGTGRRSGTGATSGAATGAGSGGTPGARAGARSGTAPATGARSGTGGGRAAATSRGATGKGAKRSAAKGPGAKGKGAKGKGAKGKGATSRKGAASRRGVASRNGATRQNPRTFGGAALAWAIGALLVCPVEHLGYVAVPVGVGAFVAGLRTMRRARGGRRPGRTTVALWAMVLGLLAAAAAVPVQVSYAVNGARDESPVAVDGEPVVDVPPEHPLTVADVAFGPDPDDTGEWWYAVTVDNPNPDHRFESALMSVEVHDADGVLVAADPVYVDALPGTSVVAGTFYDLGGYTPTHVEARLPVVQRSSYTPGVGTLTVGDLTTEPRSWGGVVVRAEVTSTLREDGYAKVVVLAQDRSGETVAVARTYVEIPARGTAGVELTFYSDLPEGVTYEAYATP